MNDVPSQPGTDLDSILARLSSSDERIKAEVAERALAEQALRASERRLRTALCAANVGIWDIDLATGQMFTSANLSGVLGFEVGNSIRNGFRQLHPDDRQRVHAHYTRATRGEEFFDLEYRCIHPQTGEIVWLRSRGHLVPDGDGGPGNYMGVTQNVTDRKRRESNTNFLAELDMELDGLRVETDIMRTAASRIARQIGCDNVAFTEVDDAVDTAEVLYVLNPSPRASPDHVYRIADFLSAGYLADLRAGRMVVVDDVTLDPRTAEHAGAFTAHNVVSDIESPFLSDGRWRFHLSVLRARAHDWRRDEIELVRDLTVRLWLRLERARAEAELRATERGMQLATSAGHVYAWRINLANKRLTLGENLPRMLDFDPPLSAEEFFRLVHPDDRERTIAAYEATVSDEAPLDIEYRFLHPRTGETLWLSSEGNVLPAPDGAPQWLVGVTVDVTRRKRAEEALRDADRRKDEFLATLAHELRNPLAPLRNGIEILRRTSAGNETAVRVQALMERQVETMSRLVDDLLEVARISRGNIELRCEPVDLPSVVHNAIETSRPLIERAGHEVTVSLPFASLPLRADPLRLAQILSNLINNAAKYTDPGGHIEIAARSDGDEVEISVSDNGIGIPEDMLPQVFELFAQVDRTCGRTQGGLGIGLSLVRRLVELHGGSVTAHSAGLGKGSRFVLRLPLEPAGSIVQQAPASPATQPRAAVTLCRTLVVDDNHDSADSLHTMLTLMGAETEVAYDGASALQVGERFHPDAILLDIGMPGIDGYELARRIREHPTLHGVRLIALTGWGQQEDRLRSREAGIDHHLLKPVDVQALEQLLDCSAVEGHEHPRAA